MTQSTRSPIVLIAALLVVAMCGTSQAAILAPQGIKYLYLSTGPAENGGGDTGFDLDTSGSNEFDEAHVQLAFDAGAGGVLSFKYNVLTSEFNVDGVDDLVIFSIDGNPVFQSSINAPDGVEGTFDPLGPFTGIPMTGPDGSQFSDGELGLMMFMSSSISAGVHTVSFTVLDEFDDLFDTALVIDELALDGVVFEDFEDEDIGSPPAGATEARGNVAVAAGANVAVLPQPETLGLLLLGFAGVAVRRLGSRRR